MLLLVTIAHILATCHFSDTVGVLLERYSGVTSVFLIYVCVVAVCLYHALSFFVVAFFAKVTGTKRHNSVFPNGQQSSLSYLSSQSIKLSTASLLCLKHPDYVIIEVISYGMK